MIFSKRIFRKHFLFAIFYLSFLFTGLSIYKDYGISWDEPISRENNGVLNYKFITTNDNKQLLKSMEKYHGPAFEIFLAGIENIFGLKNTREIYPTRHLFTFLVFAIAVLFFYLICFRYMKSQWVSLAGVAFLVLSPRIFADAFYNYKDLVFMSFLIINLYTALRFLEKKNFLTSLTHALITGIVIDIRILGVIIPCFTFLSLFFEFIKNRFSRKMILKSFLFYSFFLVGTIILCWPVLWMNPLKHFILSLKEMSNYPWVGKVLFNGEIFLGTPVPWYYIPYWILISTPILYSILFFTGLLFLVRKLFFKVRLSTFEWLNIYVFFIPLFTIIILKSIVYDGWRHLYFIYPSFLIVALIGLDNLIRSIYFKKYLKIIVSACVLFLVYIFVIMILYHPYENVYFNFIAGKSLKEARQKFDVDYWGLSYKEGLEYVLKNDSSKKINQEQYTRGYNYF